MTYTEWYAHEDKVLLFKELLNNPVLNQALEVVQEHGLPIARPIPSGTDLIQYAALTNARREGYFEALRNLRMLAVAPQPKETQELKPWKGQFGTVLQG
jgi:hypothetical protein